jgi:hypothetical protein
MRLQSYWNKNTILSGDLNEYYGFQKSNVINVCTGKRKSHGGFIWKYKSDI